MLVPGKKLSVFSIRTPQEGGASVWTKAGNAVVNRDGSINLFLDVVPLGGKLHVRETPARRDAQAPRGEPHSHEAAQVPSDMTAVAMGGH